ncbi:MAG TPA: hypothetical protein VK793_17010, partial [Steroidobacteraceae bacterium]|nr:hypothetical protein [Steroidobacteraceae bacterium]
MIAKETRSRRERSLSNTRFAIALLATTALGGTLAYADEITFFLPGNLLLSHSIYTSPASILTAGTTVLPPGCTAATAAASATPCVTANADGTYPTVFNNDQVDASFGITAPILLDELRPNGDLVQSIEVPNTSERGVNSTADQMVTSFSSKSEIALNLSLDRNSVSFMGYLAPVNTIDVSNSNTPAVVDPTNPVPGADYRVVASVDAFGQFHFTKTNAYSGNNGRAAILNNANGANVYYTVGNAGNGANPQPVGVIEGAGAQIIPASRLPEAHQVVPETPSPVGAFSVAELGDKADKVGKDTNFRGLTVFNNVVYLTKGSGSNGINTVYFIDTTGTACPSGVGVPAAGATLPSSPIAYDPSLLQTQGVTPYNMCVLKGFPTTLAKTSTAFPFGIWFANADTLYVADEGSGDNTFSTSSGTYTNAAAQTTAGLQKWVFNGSSWTLAYTLSGGLNLGIPYTVKGYPAGDNAVTGLPWAPATDGLRNITGRVNRNGTVSIWAITSTVSGGGDQGADPNKLVQITDDLAATAPGAHEQFATVRSAGFGQVLRGVS